MGNLKETISKVTIAQRTSQMMKPACLKRLIKPKYMSGAAAQSPTQITVIRMFQNVNVFSKKNHQESKNI